jgi:hypothetical protein
MCKHHQDIQDSQSFPAPLKATEEEKAAIGIQVGSISIQITVHENPFGISKDVIVPIRPSRFFVGSNIVIKFFWIIQSNSNQLHESSATDLT